MDETEYILSKAHDPTRPWCPECDPSVDPLTELVVVCYCSEHCPPVAGTSDRLSDPSYLPLIGNSDAGGALNKAWCDFVHRKELPPSCSQDTRPTSSLLE